MSLQAQLAALILEIGADIKALNLNSNKTMPTLITSGDTFSIPENTQGLFSYPIDIENDGVLDVSGVLVEVQ